MLHDPRSVSEGLASAFARSTKDSVSSAHAALGSTLEPGWGSPAGDVAHASAHDSAASAAHLMSHWAEGAEGPAAEYMPGIPHALLPGPETPALHEQQPAGELDGVEGGVGAQAETHIASDPATPGEQPHIHSTANTPRDHFSIGALWGKAKSAAARTWQGVKTTISGGLDAAQKGISWAGTRTKPALDAAKKGASWIGEKTKPTWDAVKKGVSWAGDKTKPVLDATKKGASWLGDKAQQGWKLGKKGASWLGDKAQQGCGAAKKEVGQVYGDLKGGMDQEGVVGFLNDPIGAMDRQHAQHELADGFQVVGPDYKGVRTPNTVTQAEYERIAHTYSDIRLGRGDLTLDQSALKTDKERDAYREGALRDVAALMQTGSGRRELEQLHNNRMTDENGNARRSFFGLGPQIHHHTTMVPLFRQDARGRFDASLGLDRTNGYAAPDKASTDRQLNPNGSLGKANSGTDVHIRYNPGVNVGDAYSGLSPTNPWLGQERSDVLLAHEMNHAVKQTAGMVDPRAVQATDNAANVADPDMANDAAYRDQNGNPLGRVEHQAAGLGMYAADDMTENDYRRERRQLADHGGVGQIAGDEQLQQRTTYVLRNPPRAPAPAARPVPAPGPGPAIPEFMNHANW